MKLYNDFSKQYINPSNENQDIIKIIKEKKIEKIIYVCDLGEVQRLYHAWSKTLPRVVPFYAVKCHPNPALVSKLGSLGVGFDCASANEIEQIVDIGISPDRIIYANPSKIPADLRYASKIKVQVATYDTVFELDKVAKFYPELQMILRIRTDDPCAMCHLGNKFGSEPEMYLDLINSAKDRGINVIGTAFHVGSNSISYEAFNQAIACTRMVFEIGKSRGYSMHIVDLGGGFIARLDQTGEVIFNPVFINIEKTLEQFFPESDGFTIISEPGRYFVETACSLMTQIFSSCAKYYPDEQMEIKYWITDGLYGSMNCLLYDHTILKPYLLRTLKQNEEIFTSTLFGPTCDGLDTVIKAIILPKLLINEWIGFRDMGAYTLAGASEFNGMDVCSPKFLYILDR